MSIIVASLVILHELLVLLDHGRLEPVRQIVERITGRKPHPATVWRWSRRPGRGGPLPARLVFGTWHSTEAAVRAWLERKSAYVPRTPAAPSGPSDEDLRERGLLDLPPAAPNTPSRT